MNEYEYAGFWVRTGAAIIDSILILFWMRGNWLKQCSLPHSKVQQYNTEVGNSLFEKVLGV
nr:hypothetical protein [uncultured Desulfobacter sp.]